jgi:DtxR family Mn-dependent transcriptional regulator
LQIALRSEAEWVSTGELATALNVSPGTVTSMLKSLAEPKESEAGIRPPLVHYKPYEGIRLTGAGEQIALRMLRRHRLIELFLVRTLNLTWDRVHEEAENMEHAVSDYLVDQIDEFLGHPPLDPHGDPIPAADGAMRGDLDDTVLLSRVPAGRQVRLVRVLNQGPEFLRFLSDSGLELDVVAVVRQNSAEAGVVTLDVAGRDVSMAHTAAKTLVVKQVDE